MSGSIFALPPYNEIKTMLEELELNPGPHAFRVTVLTTAPWLLGQKPKIYLIWFLLTHLLMRKEKQLARTGIEPRSSWFLSKPWSFEHVNVVAVVILCWTEFLYNLETCRKLWLVKLSSGLITSCLLAGNFQWPRGGTKIFVRKEEKFCPNEEVWIQILSRRGCQKILART